MKVHLKCKDAEFNSYNFYILHLGSDQDCSKIYNEKFYAKLNKSKLYLPSRESLLIGLYDYGSASKRSWYKFIPELDLQSRFNIKECPSLVYAPKETCTGWTDWCVRESVLNGNLFYF